MTQNSLDRLGGAIYLAIVLISVVGTWLTHASRLSPLTMLLTAIAAAAFLAADFISERRQRDSSSSTLPPTYFLLQFTLAAIIVALFIRDGVLGVAWLLFMPLLAQAILVSSRLVAVLIASGGLLVMLAAIFHLSGGRTSSIMEAGFGFTSAAAFVFIFTSLLIQEQRARAEASRLANELAAANQKLAHYASQIEELATARERNRLAREIHDGLGHALTTISIQLEAARTMLEIDAERASRAIETAQSQAREGLEDVRKSVSAMRATPLEGRSLEEALVELARQPDDQLTVELELQEMERPLPRPTELAIFRIVQEALTNVRRHAGASSASVRLQRDTNESVRLTVRDNGRGAAEVVAGFGLLGIRERVRHLGGDLTIEATPGAGFALEVTLPE